MKKLSLTILAVILASQIVIADPPKKVNLAYNNNVLSIEAIHPVKDVKTHYIDQITISVDGKDVKTIKVKQQSSTSSQVEQVSLPNITKGVKIKVSCRCNEFGNKSNSIKVK
ncbi:MAG: hypothetical protein H6Q16_1393 [Bacteroidetes bacterium]|nr:hypothetical protein [Bacteroidota bacterium]